MSADEAAPATDQRKSNLARIRENQRRSRARRKEYLQELEAKYRSCEQLGVEASSEIQAAARKVIEENKRLRLLLLQRGFTEAEIEKADASEGLEGFSGGTSSPPALRATGAVSKLEGLLERRRECRPSVGGGRCGPAGGASSEAGRPAAPTTIAQQQQQRSGGLPALLPQLRPNPPETSVSNPSPYSSSSTSARQTPIPGGFANMYAGGPPPTSMQNHQQQQQHPIDCGMPYDSSGSTFPWEQPFENTPELQEDTNPVYPDHTSEQSSSCYVAAEAIRSLNPVLGYELELELGCDSGEDCNVPNSQIFSLMDQYSDGRG